MPLPENVSIGKVFNRYGNEFEVERELRELTNQQRKRNLTIVGFVIFGGIAGYMLSSKANFKSWSKVGATILWGTAFGVTVSMLTKNKYDNRNQAIKEKSQDLEQMKYFSKLAKQGLDKTLEKIKTETSNNNN